MKEFRTSKRFTAFADRAKTNNFALGDNGELLAYDSVAGHYTVCHSLTPHQERMIRAEARKK